MTCPKVSVIILNWNRWSDTIECLESIQKMAYDNYRIIVIDNASTDLSVKKIKEWANGNICCNGKFTEYCKSNKPVLVVSYDRVMAERGGDIKHEDILDNLPCNRSLVLIESDENLGFASGCNVGIKYALLKNTDYIYLLNNDTVQLSNVLSILVGFLEKNEQYQIATGQIRYYDYPDRIWNCGGMLTWPRVRKYDYGERSVSMVPSAGMKDVTYITNCTSLIRSNLFRNSGLLSTQFFHGEEDIELSHRVKNLGFKMACCYDAIIYHKVGRSLQTSEPEVLAGKYYLFLMNRFILMRSYYSFFIWHIWRMLCIPYFIRLLRKDGKLPWKLITAICSSVLKDSLHIRKINREYFQYALTEKFKRKQF